MRIADDNSSCTDGDLRSIFSQFGHVQTCIVNQEKRHGFIKMISRRDALAAKEGMEHYKKPDLQLRVRLVKILCINLALFE